MAPLPPKVNAPEPVQDPRRYHRRAAFLWGLGSTPTPRGPRRWACAPI